MEGTLVINVQAVTLALALALAGQPGSPAPAVHGSHDPGFLVIAPDRGFLGDEAVRDAFDAFSVGRNAALVFVTDERTAASLDSALQDVAAKGARHVVVLPLFLSRGDPR